MKRQAFLLFVVGVMALSAALFLLCYEFDNKYMTSGPQADNGVLHFDARTQQSYSAMFLRDGWEIYRSRLLGPGDFSGISPDEIVYIGQYGGFEGADATRNAHGSATYRMKIVLPEESQSYMLELPEIFSAYRLYVNGMRMEQFGEPSPDAYWPQTGNAAISFVAAGEAEIIVAVSDFSHMYSGMVYPPAFGAAPVVARMIQIRLVLRAAFCAVALALGVFFLICGAFLRRNRPMILYALICLCLVGFICYPVVKSVLRSGVAWYGFENFCFCAMLSLVMLLQMHLFGDKRGLSKAFLVFGAFVCGCAILRALFPTDNLGVIAAYSVLIDLYKWSAAVCLGICMVRNAGRERRGAHAILAGVTVFGCALIMDRILPDFEPIYGGWFLEIAGAALLVAVGIVLGQDVVRQYRERMELAHSVHLAQVQIAFQSQQYLRITKDIAQTKAARHDLRHQLAAMSGYLATGDADGAKAYIDELTRSIPTNFERMICENFAVNAVALHYLALAESEGIQVKLKLVIPQAAGGIADQELCVIIGNLFENAIEACRFVDEGERFIRLSSSIKRPYLCVVMDNSCDENYRMQGGSYLSRKRDGHGMGLVSVKMIAEKYDGHVRFEAKGREFHSSVVLQVEGI